MFRFRANFAIFIVILLSSILLSSCSTLNDKVQDGSQTSNEQAGENDADKTKGPGGESQLDSVGQLENSFQGVDPMADIQINAEIKKAYKDVAGLNKVKKYKVALNLLDGMQKKYPQLSGPDYQKARIYLSQGKLQQALDSVELSLKNNQRNYYSLNLKGIILKELGQFEQSKEVYLEAIKVYPPYPNSHLNLGVLADIYMGDLSLALIQYREYMRLVDNSDKTVENWILEIERRIKVGQ